MSELQERDAMICRSCGNEERASEGYPCSDCGTFICMMCVWRAIERCESCTAAMSHPVPVASLAPVVIDVAPDVAPPLPPAPKPLGLIPTGIDWPEH